MTRNFKKKNLTITSCMLGYKEGGLELRGEGDEGSRHEVGLHPRQPGLQGKTLKNDHLMENINSSLPSYWTTQFRQITFFCRFGQKKFSNNL